jgi:dolichol-phosphate mannosyltransferase
MHLLLLHMMALMLPSGLYAACISLWRPPAAQQFVRLFFLVPCGVFLLYSLRHVPKLNWTGPAFLALLPSMSHHLVAIASGARFQGARALQRMWGWTLPLWGLGLGCTLYYLAFGISFIPYSPTMYRALGWESLASGIGALAQRIEEQEGAPPVIVGMDTHFIASELAFYLRKAGKPYAVTSRNLLGKSSLMFRFWDSAERFHGRTVILVGQTQKELLLPGIAAYFTALGPVEEVKTEKGGFPLHTFYARVGHELKAREKDSWPAYTSAEVSFFNQAGESAFSAKLSYDFTGLGLTGVTAYVLFVHGWEQVDPSTGAPVPNDNEYDVDVQWRPGWRFLKGVWLRTRYGIVHQYEVPRQYQHDFRIIVNYDVSLFW